MPWTLLQVPGCLLPSSLERCMEMVTALAETGGNGSRTLELGSAPWRWTALAPCFSWDRLYS